MKPVIVFLCVAVLCAHVDSYPESVVERANEDNDNDDVAEVYIVPMERRRAVPRFPFGNSDDFGSINPVVRERDYGMTPFFNPFFHQRNDDLDGFLASMQAMLLKMRQEMDEMMHRLPPTGDSDVDTKIGVNDEGPLQNKSTSTTKVVDGHVVTVNETTFVNGDDKIGAVFRIKVVEVKPTEKSSSGNKPAEESTENAEISPENVDDRIENVDNSNEENNEIPTEKVGSEVDDLNQASA